MRPLQFLAVLVALLVCVGLVVGGVWLVGEKLPAVATPRPDVQPVPPPEAAAADQAGATPAATGTAADPASAPVTVAPPAPNPDKEHFEKNPFELARGAAVPKVEIPEISVNFGVMLQGTTGQHDFVIRNVGQAPLKLAKGPTQCKCTLSGLKQQEIPAGGEGTIHLEWTPKELGGFLQQAVIWTNDPEREKIVLYVEGEVSTKLVVMPKLGWNLGTLQPNTVTPLKGRISSSIVDGGKILSLESSSELLQVEMSPIKDEETLGAAKWGYDLQGQLIVKDNIGPVNATITVRTNVPENETITLPLTAVVLGAATIVGPGWYAGQRVLDFGTLPAGKGATRKLTLMTKPIGEELKFLKVESTLRFVKVTLTPVKTGEGGGRERYALTFEIPPDAPPGVWALGNYGIMKITTNHPQLPELDINLQVTIK